jgi:hypothetical protein
VATWADFEAAAPEQVAVVQQVWTEPLPVAYLATVRRDGAPRLHPFCPVRADGRLYAVIPRRSPKGDDLRRDARCVVHATPGPDDAELCIRARAVERTDDDAVRASVVAAVDAAGPTGMAGSARRDPIFELDVEQVDTAHWIAVGQPGTHAVRQRWLAEDRGRSDHVRP